jgi:NADPH2:quinone reductase
MEELARERLEMIGTTFRTRTDDEKVAVVETLRSGLDLVGSADILRPLVDRTFPWSEALAAQSALARNTYLGKIVLEVEAGS